MEWLLQGFRYELESTVRPQTVECYFGSTDRITVGSGQDSIRPGNGDTEGVPGINARYSPGKVAIGNRVSIGSVQPIMEWAQDCPGFVDYFNP